MNFPLPLHLCLVALLISGCQTEKSVRPRDLTRAPSVPPTRQNETNTVSDQRSEALARFATGLSYELNDKSEQAMAEFYRAALADPANQSLAIELGQRFLQLRQSEKAVEVLLNASKHPQASGETFSWLARAYSLTQQTNLAVIASQTAIRKSPKSILGYQMLAEIFLKNGQSSDLIKYLNGALQQSGTDAIFLIHLGDLYAKTLAAQPKNIVLKQRGLDALNRAAALKPTNPNMRQRLADTFAELGATEKAAEIYLILLGEYREMPLMRDALREKLANIYLHGSDKSKAAEQLEALVRESPTRYPEAWYYLGTFSYDDKKFEKAAEYFARAIVVNPEMEQAYADLAGTQLNLGQTKEALDTLEKARQKFPNSFTTEFFTGLAFARSKNFPAALKHFTIAEAIGNATESKRLNYLFYFQVGTTFERNHDYEQAEKYLTKCLEFQPEFSDALNYLGYMWADRGVNLEKARELIEKAVALEPKNAAYLDSLGWAFYKLNEPESALEYLLKAVELSDEPDAAVLDHLGDVYQALKLNGKAREAWQKSLAIEPSEEIRKKVQALPPL